MSSAWITLMISRNQVSPNLYFQVMGGVQMIAIKCKMRLMKMTWMKMRTWMTMMK